MSTSLITSIFVVASIITITIIIIIIIIINIIIIAVITSWLRDFLSYVESSRNYGDTSMQIASETDFVSTLRDIYLSDQVNLVSSILYFAEFFIDF